MFIHNFLSSKRVRFGLKPAVLLFAFALFAIGIAGCDSAGTENEAGSLFDSGSIAADGTFSYTFEEEGTYEYFCKIHSPDMQGSIVVDASAQSTSPDTVEMVNLQFNPSQMTVAPNTRIVWVNRAGMAHTVSSGNPSSDDNYTGNEGGNTGGY